jgi:hypothetical protein
MKKNPCLIHENLNYIKMPGQFMVLPIAHGKSYNHDETNDIYEADQVINCNGTDELMKLRSEAKTDGSWERYDQVWGSEIRERLGKKGILLVPDQGVGYSAGRNLCAGIYLLQKSVWIENMMRRGEDYRKWEWHYDKLAASTTPVPKVFSSNEKLREQLLEDVKYYMTQKLPSTRDTEYEY